MCEILILQGPTVIHFSIHACLTDIEQIAKNALLRHLSIRAGETLFLKVQKWEGFALMTHHTQGKILAMFVIFCPHDPWVFPLPRLQTLGNIRGFHPFHDSLLVNSSHPLPLWRKPHIEMQYLGLQQSTDSLHVASNMEKCATWQCPRRSFQCRWRQLGVTWTIPAGHGNKLHQIDTLPVFVLVVVVVVASCCKLLLLLQFYTKPAPSVPVRPGIVSLSAMLWVLMIPCFSPRHLGAATGLCIQGIVRPRYWLVFHTCPMISLISAIIDMRCRVSVRDDTFLSLMFCWSTLNKLCMSMSLIAVVDTVSGEHWTSRFAKGRMNHWIIVRGGAIIESKCSSSICCVSAMRHEVRLMSHCWEHQFKLPQYIFAKVIFEHLWHALKLHEVWFKYDIIYH